MRRAAARGHHVLFVETDQFLGVHLLQLLTRPGRRSLLRRLLSFEQVTPNVRVRKSLNLLPWGQRYRLSNRVNGRLSATAVRRAARGLPTPRVAWLYDPRATWAIGRTGDAFAVYDCVDDYAEQAAGARNRALIADADRVAAARSRVVFATTTPLAERHVRTNPRTHLVRNVGDFEHFSGAAARADLAALPRPVYGFAGNFLPAKVDLPLLIDFASGLAEGTLLLAGPVRTGVAEHLERLASLPNVRLLGAVPYDDLPAVVAAFDVALIPYLENDYTRSCFPLKLYEYLAAGKPVVATGLPELRGMEPDVVVAKPDEFAAAAARALELETPADVERRSAIAARNTWETRAARLLELVSAEL
jgi:glycosyltransferase involved in cell wall biosynthesis